MREKIANIFMLIALVGFEQEEKCVNRRLALFIDIGHAVNARMMMKIKPYQLQSVRVQLEITRHSKATYDK